MKLEIGKPDYPMLRSDEDIRGGTIVDELGNEWRLSMTNMEHMQELHKQRLFSAPTDFSIDRKNKTLWVYPIPDNEYELVIDYE